MLGVINSHTNNETFIIKGIIYGFKTLANETYPKWNTEIGGPQAVYSVNVLLLGCDVENVGLESICRKHGY